MAIFTHDELIRLIESGAISIYPYTEASVGPASIDCTLGTSFRIFKRDHSHIDIIHDSFDPSVFTELIEAPGGITLMPHETVLGVTVEKITLPPTICGWIQGRSRFARIGLMVHITSSFIQPGISNHQVLEILNAGPYPITLHPGVKLCQIILEEAKGKAMYTGVFKNQETP